MVKLGELPRRSLNAVYLVMMKVFPSYAGFCFWFFTGSAFSDSWWKTTFELNVL